MPLLTDWNSGSVDDIIDNAPEDVLRNMLHAICHSNSRVYNQVRTFCDNIKSVDECRKTSKKRKASSNIAVCIRCLDAFEEDDNHDRACFTHPGNWDADLDHDAWVDMWDGDFGEHGPNTQEWFDDMPEGFVWNCCKRRGNKKGCRASRHVTKPAELATVKDVVWDHKARRDETDNSEEENESDDEENEDEESDSSGSEKEEEDESEDE